MVKKGQANIIVIVLIVLIILVAVAIIWNAINPLIKEKSQEVQFGQFTVNLEIKNVVVFENGVTVISVNRGSGNEELDGLKFIFYDEAGNSVTRDAMEINELETKTYSFSAMSEIGKIEKIGVAPIINGNLGMETESKPDAILKIPSGVVSWWRFDDLNDFIGGNTCEIIDGGLNNGVLDGKASCDTDDLSGDNLAISFWVKGNSDKIIIKKGENNKISTENKKLGCDFMMENGTSDEELNKDWNHIVISLSPAFSKIYVNKVPKVFQPFYFEGNNESLVINGEIDDVMIFDRPITNIEGIYNVQGKE